MVLPKVLYYLCAEYIIFDRNGKDRSLQNYETFVKSKPTGKVKVNNERKCQAYNNECNFIEFCFNKSKLLLI